MQALRELYIELLKNCVTDNIYKNQVHVDTTGHPIHNVSAQKVVDGTYWPDRAHTMIGLKRLDNIKFCVEYCLNNNIDGDFIETGVWRGGATIFMKGILKAHGSNRKVFVADSFEGLPPPEEKYVHDRGDPHHSYKYLAVSLEEVKNNFRAYDLLDDNVIFIKGFFETSLKTAPINKLAVLRLDGDMYSSTIQVLDTLYDKVTKGGFIIIDDYTLKGARAAVIDFRDKRQIKDEIVLIGKGYSAYWIKS